MRVSSFVSALLVFAASHAGAANLAIIDSGVDYKHRDLAAKMWKNPNSSTSVKGKTYDNDTYGWNFAEKNNQVIDYKYLGTFSPDCTRIFEVQAKIIQGTATEAEKSWYKGKKEDPAFLKELQKFGNFVHGTHVAGISSADANSSRLIALKLIPTEPPMGRLARLVRQERQAGTQDNPLAKMMLDMLAKQQAKLLIETGDYVAAVNGEVANGSFGTSVAAVSPIIAQLLKNFLGKEPTAEETKEHAIYFVGKIVQESKAFVGAAPKTLFVFAAGNDATDNDTLPVSPANVKADNSIAVAATLGVSRIAPFSNYGRNNVEVAAPGVAIPSTIPGDATLAMSGTSMAAPYVTNVAGLVKDKNRTLQPADIKRILMETVDVKDFLKGKVQTSGIVNRERALRAAELSRQSDLGEAIRRARYEVADMREDIAALARVSAEQMLVLPLPSPF